MGAGRLLLTPLVVAAAVARSRRRGGGASDPGSDGRAPADTATARSARPAARTSARTPARTPGAHADGSGDGRRSSGGPSAAAAGVPGGRADTPTEVPAAGWKDILRRTKQQVKDDNVPLMSAGVAFYVFIALFPALIAAVTVYGLVADPQQVEDQLAGLTDALPEASAELITSQLEDIAGSSGQALGWGLVASLAGALFAASGGMQNLIKAVNIAYDEEETRGFIRLRALALLMTLGAVVFLAVAVGLVAVLPVVLNATGMGGAAVVGVQIARWLGLVLFALVALAVLYRYAPDRDAPRFAWTGVGSLVATVLWVIGSIGFSLYVSNFGSYSETYGALAGVIVLLLWLFLTSFIVLLGAEINSEAEQQTSRDTTTGPARPLGERDAVKADTLPSNA